MASAVLPTILPFIRIRVTTSSVMAASKPLYSRREPSNSDSGYTQFNYSELLGGVSAAAISTYTYYPQSEQNFGNGMSVYGTQMGWDAVTYRIKDFWPDLRKKLARNRNNH